MPFKPIAEPEDYPERYQTRPRDGEWVAKHQAKNMEEALGEEVWDRLEEREESNEPPLP